MRDFSNGFKCPYSFIDKFCLNIYCDNCFDYIQYKVFLDSVSEFLKVYKKALEKKNHD